MSPSFDSPELACALDAHGRVLLYDQAEAKLSGRDARAVLGLDFFAEVAPRLCGQEYEDRIDIETGRVGDFEDPDGGPWILHRCEH